MKVIVTIRGMRQGPLTKIYKRFNNAVRVYTTIDKQTGQLKAIVDALGDSFSFDLDRYDVIAEV